MELEIGESHRLTTTSALSVGAFELFQRTERTNEELGNPGNVHEFSIKSYAQADFSAWAYGYRFAG
jgi:hypothetical protein